MTARLKTGIRAFTLIELMVSISIVVMVTSVVMVRQSAFNGAVLLRNQAYEVAFAIRQAQLLAVSGSDEGIAGAQVYGVKFSRVAGSRQTYQLFHDKDDDGVFTPDEAVGLAGRLDRRFEVRDFEKVDGSSQGTNDVQVTFRRPNFDAIFHRTSGAVLSGPMYIAVAKTGNAGTDNGTVRCVEITSPGQIQVRDCP